MKAVILAGGMGTRLSEETSVLPKPLVRIGFHPIIWHIMSIFENHGVTEFIVCAGFKQELIKDYFLNFYTYQSDFHLDLESNELQILRSNSKPWKVKVIDTGLATMTGGRIKRVAEYLGNETFCMTYGDGVANVDITQLVQSHKKSNKLATVTAVRAPGRFGDLVFDGEKIVGFSEKREGDTRRINGGFFVLEPGIMDFIDGDQTVWESSPMTRLADLDQLNAFLHDGFWQPMDTLRDKVLLDKLAQETVVPWFSLEN